MIELLHIILYVLDQYEERVIKEGMRKIEDDTRVDGKNCITFVPRTNESVYLKIFPGDGCWSHVSVDLFLKNNLSI